MEGVTTGISAADRARTIRVAIDPNSRPADLARPGHVFPLRAREGGVLVRAGQTEAVVDLAQAGGVAAGRRDLRDHERRRDHGAGAATDGVLRAARTEDDFGGGPDPLPPAERALHPTADRELHPDRVRRFPDDRLCEHDRAGAAPGAGAWGDRAPRTTCWCACTRTAC